MKDNKLIAEFMGWNTTDCDEIFTEPAGMMERYTTAEMEFQTSWDWLMPVIENIDHLQYESVKGIEDALSTRHIGDTHKAVVEFIKTHNAKRLMSWVSYDEPFICGSCREHCSEYTYSEDRDVDECNNCKTSNHENSNPR